MTEQHLHHDEGEDAEQHPQAQPEVPTVVVKLAARGRTRRRSGGVIGLREEVEEHVPQETATGETYENEKKEWKILLIPTSDL